MQTPLSHNFKLGNPYGTHIKQNNKLWVCSINVYNFGVETFIIIIIVIIIHLLECNAT